MNPWPAAPIKWATAVARALGRKFGFVCLIVALKSRDAERLLRDICLGLVMILSGFAVDPRRVPPTLTTLLKYRYKLYRKIKVVKHTPRLSRDRLIAKDQRHNFDLSAAIKEGISEY